MYNRILGFPDIGRGAIAIALDRKGTLAITRVSNGYPPIIPMYHLVTS